MKIVIVGPVYPYRGGNALYVSHLYEMLCKIFDVKVINYKLLYPSLFFPGTTQEDKSSIKIKQVPSDRVVNSINPLSWIKAANIIKKEQADLVVFDWWNPFFGLCHYTISFLLKKKYKDKILFITENVISHEKRFIDKLLTQIGLKNASKFLVLSKIVEETVKYYSGERKIYKSALPIYDCYQFENITNTNAIKKDLEFNQDDKVILFFGYVRKYKGLLILIEAIPEVLREYTNSRLLVVGEFYDSPNEYYEKIKELNLESHVKIINEFVPNEEVGKYFSVSDVVVLPYKSGTQSGVLNIAYGFNKPVVVTKVGSLPDDVEEEKTGVVIEPGSSKELTKGICKVFDLYEKEDFSKNIRNKTSSQEFSNTIKVFEKIISDSENDNT
ncbi:MAG: glycosyltransferase [Ignavibacteria bacterium]|nr:glycosyltransferase [Ignavibacteria bacterium]